MAKTSKGRPRPVRTSGFARIRDSYMRILVAGGVACVTGVVTAWQGLHLWPYVALQATFAALALAFGAWGLRVGSAGSLLSSSFNLIQAGRLAEAGALLDTIQGHAASTVAAARDYQRAMMALRLGDLAEGSRLAGIVVAAPLSMMSFSSAAARRTAAHGLRAWARAASGDLDAARSDVEAVRSAPDEEGSALAHAALAEAIIMERTGDRAGLAALLRRDRKLLLNVLDVRERGIVRAMQRMLKAAPTTVYRTAPDRHPVDPGGGEPSIGEWLGRVAPELAAFGPGRAATASVGAAVASPPGLASRDLRDRFEHAASPQAMASAGAAHGRRNGRTALLWALLVVVFLVGWQVLIPGLTPDEDLRTLVAERASPAVLGFGVLAFLVGLFGWRVRRSHAQMRRFNRLASAIARGRDVGAELDEMARARHPSTAAQAELLRAGVAERKGQLPAALRRVDAGQARLLHSEESRAAAAPWLSPMLTATRAHVLAGLGRADEAAAELAYLPADFVLLDRTRFSVELVALLARGDVDGAARLVESTSPDLSIGPRDELVRDLVRAATAPAGAGPVEVARLRDEVREDEESRRWAEQVVPALLSRFESATTVVPGDEEDDRDAAAEAEALAEESAATLEPSLATRSP